MVSGSQRHCVPAQAIEYSRVASHSGLPAPGYVCLSYCWNSGSSMKGLSNQRTYSGSGRAQARRTPLQRSVCYVPPGSCLQIVSYINHSNPIILNLSGTSRPLTRSRVGNMLTYRDASLRGSLRSVNLRPTHLQTLPH